MSEDKVLSFGRLMARKERHNCAERVSDRSHTCAPSDLEMVSVPYLKSYRIGFRPLV